VTVLRLVAITQISASFNSESYMVRDAAWRALHTELLIGLASFPGFVAALSLEVNYGSGRRPGWI
jgi:hypothetical protein